MAEMKIVKQGWFGITDKDEYGRLRFQPFVGRIVAASVFGLAILMAASMWGCPQYEVWNQGLVGQAELARAQQNRMIKIAEAEARMESAKRDAQAEVERARGVAQANQIIGDSLKGNTEYLRYLWIQGMQTNQMQVIYVPTEANLPILEAQRWEQADKYNTRAHPPSTP